MMRLVHSDRDDRSADHDRAASAWVVRLTSGNSTEADHKEFRAWKAQEAGHGEALRRVLADWERIGTALPRLEARRPARGAGRRISALAIAASLALTVGVTHEYRTDWRFDEVTRPGERRIVTLPNGNRMVMRGDTAIWTDSGPAGSAVEIERGTVFLSLENTPHGSFSVRAGDTVYHDIGTAFSVARDGTGSRVFVAAGKVRAVRDGRSVDIEPGQVMRVSGNGEMRLSKSVEHAPDTSWMRGRVQFSNRPLGEILAAVAPDYDGRVIFLSGRSRNDMLSATIDLSRIDEWIDALARSDRIKVSRLAGFTLIY